MSFLTDLRCAESIAKKFAVFIASVKRCKLFATFINIDSVSIASVNICVMAIARVRKYTGFTASVKICKFSIVCVNISSVSIEVFLAIVKICAGSILGVQRQDMCNIYC